MDNVISELDAMQQTVGVWQVDTFGGYRGDEVRNNGLLKHLRRELDELCEKGTAEEAADMVILLLGYAWNNDFSLWDAIRAKHEVNIKRTWGERDAEGVIEHIEEQQEAHNDPRG